MTEPRINISLDDLDGGSARRSAGASDPPLAATACTACGQPLKANTNFCNSCGGSAQVPPPPDLPPVSEPVETSMGTTSRLTSLGSSSVIVGLVAGPVAGLVGYLIGIAIFNGLTLDQDYREPLIAGAVSLLLGLCVLGWPDLSAGAFGRALRQASLGASVGLGAGLVSLGIADQVFRFVSDGTASGDEPASALWAAWAIIGTLTGLAIGMTGGARRALNGLIGGALGGTLGGGLYLVLAGTERGATTTRAHRCRPDGHRHRHGYRCG